MAKVLVTGSTGFVGSYLCKELTNSGYTVRALIRDDSKRDVLKGVPVEFVHGDITDRTSLLNAMDGVESVFHIAAIFREAKYADSVYFEVNTKGVQNVFEAAVEKGVTRVIHCSTGGVHSHIPNPPANEREPYRPADVYQLSKCEGEKVALEFIRSGKIQGSIIRPAMIWGPSDRRLLKLFKGISRRLLPIIGDGKTLFHWILVTDLARAFRLANETPAANGQVYIIAGRRPVTIRETYQAIAKEAGVKVLPFRLPAPPLQLIGTILEKICVPLSIEPPLYRRRVDFFTKTRAFDCSKAQRDLGYQAEHTFEEEVHIIYQWYKRNGWL
ncbi:MAG: NAD-dependent epimerase/dehydratase family protein [Bdellovibrionota bacterium]|jgi:dihydroflavonol-4-reductase